LIGPAASALLPHTRIALLLHGLLPLLLLRCNSIPGLLLLLLLWTLLPALLLWWYHGGPGRATIPSRTLINPLLPLLPLLLRL
jgi:hypothetical protein